MTRARARVGKDSLIVCLFIVSLQIEGKTRVRGVTTGRGVGLDKGQHLWLLSCMQRG